MYRRCTESRNEILVREDSTINGYDRTYYHTLDSSAYETPIVSLSLVCVDAADCVRVFPGEEISACDGGGGGVCWHEILSSSSRHALVEVSTSNHTRSAVRVIFLCVNQNSGHSFSCTHTKLLLDRR